MSNSGGREALLSNFVAGGRRGDFCSESVSARIEGGVGGVPLHKTC